MALVGLASCTQPVVEVFGSISGYVVSEETGAAIGGAKVTLTPTGSSQVTSTDGEFFFDNLDTQEYTLSIKKAGFEDMSQKVSVKAGVTSSVQVVLTPVQPVLSVSPTTLDFGDESSSLALDITNSGKGNLEWVIEEEIDWITCSPVSGTTSDKVASVVVKASREGMERGSYTETIVISSNGGSQIVKVKIAVGNSIKLSVDPEELDFGSVESELQLKITNNGTSTVKYDISTANEWLTLNKTTGSVQSTDYVNAIVSRQGLGAGSYSSSITISTDGGDIIIPVKMEVVAKSTPKVTIESVTDITYSSATAKGTIVSVGSSKVLRYGFCYSDENTVPTVDDNIVNLGDSSDPKSFTGTLSNLESMTKYYIRAFAENQEGVSYSSNVLNFTSGDLPKLAEVETGEVSKITAYSAVAGGLVVNFGNVGELTAHGHVWNTTGGPTLTKGDNTDLGPLTSPTSFSSILEGLEAGTTYYVRAYATNEKGTAYGEEVSFTTGLGEVELKTLEATSITHESAIVSAEIINDGKNEILEKGICYATFEEPDRYDNRVVADDDFTCTLSGLEKTTTYHARAYAKTASGKYYYGNEITFTTSEFITEATVAMGQIEELTHSNVTVSGEIVSTGSTTVTAYGHVIGKTQNVTVDRGYLEISSFEPTDEPLEFSSSFTGLDSNTTYYVRAYATNSKGTVYSDALSFTTEKNPVVLSETVIEEVTWNSVSVSAEILSSEGHTITSKGFAICKAGEDEYEFMIADDDFTLTISGLESETEYKVAAYVLTSDEKLYSSEYFEFFTTLEAPVNPTNGLYAYYTFEGNTKNTIEGAPNGSGINTSYVSGMQDSKAIKFTSAESKLNIPEGLIDGSTYTVSFWVKGMSDGHFYHCDTTADYYFSHIFGVRNGALTYAESGYSFFYNWSNTDSVRSFTHPAIDSSEWHLITMTSSSPSAYAECCLYIDGEFIDKLVCPYYNNKNRGVKFIFGGKLSHSNFNQSLNWQSMSIDNLRIYNSRALTAEEVMQIYEYER